VFLINSNTVESDNHFQVLQRQYAIYEIVKNGNMTGVSTCHIVCRYYIYNDVSFVFATH